jgi:formamidopyrimidine-DNA glycosylase
MPELPEVQVVVDTLRPRIVGRRVLAATLARADVLRPADTDLAALLVGRAVATIDRRAKRIHFSLDTGDRFDIHLGMTGQLTIDPIEQPLKRHTHLMVDLDNGAQLRFVDPRRFGGIRWHGLNLPIDRVGPEPLTMRSATLARQLATTRRAVKVALLDQGIVAGIGNIYADEALHAAGIHPLTPANALAGQEIERLSRAIKRVLRRAIRAGGSTLRDYVNGRGERGSFQTRHKVYDRAGQPCRGCREPIVRIVLGGRSTCFCAACQPARP